MGKALAYVFLVAAVLLGLLFVAGWIDGLRRDGLAQTAFTLLNWPAAAITISVPFAAIGFLCAGLSLLKRRNGP
jgi:hypothetical protein